MCVSCTSCTASVFFLEGACMCKTRFRVHGACHPCRVLDLQPHVRLLSPQHGPQSQGPLRLPRDLPGSVGLLPPLPSSGSVLTALAHTRRISSSPHSPQQGSNQPAFPAYHSVLDTCLCMSPAFPAPSHLSSHCLQGALLEFPVCVPLACSL